MKSLRRLIRQSALILMAALLLVFSVLTYVGRRRLVAPLCGWPAVRVGGDDGQDRRATPQHYREFW